MFWPGASRHCHRRRATTRGAGSISASLGISMQRLELRRTGRWRTTAQRTRSEAREPSGKRQTIPEPNTSHSMSWRALGLGLARCEPPPRLRPPSAHVNASQTPNLSISTIFVLQRSASNSSGESSLVRGHVPGTELPADFSAPLPGHVSRIDGFLRQHESPVIDQHFHAGVLPTHSTRKVPSRHTIRVSVLV